jgi:tetratricopeptide (TPR) repeat protein
MPAGIQDNSYDRRFKQLDWRYLYQEQDGFVLFEDLKAQWRHTLKVDYVLVDSRTGHTDVGGICTRQLPDSVAILFFPNEQNRRGLKTIVEDIRAEGSGPLQKAIKIHFVMSNVPDLDDDEEILAGNVSRFRETLGYEELSATIHHYNSLLLLDQAIFSLERPRSRLAQEYRKLAGEIRRANLEDRLGALEFLEDVGRRVRTRRSLPGGLEDQVSEIIKKHSTDGEILRQVARLRKRQRKWADAIVLLNQAISNGVLDPDILLTRAEAQLAIGERAEALSDILHLLNLNEAASFDLQLAVRLLVELDGPMNVLIESPAITRLEIMELAGAICQELESRPNDLPVAEVLLRRALVSTPTSSAAWFASNQLVICLIGEGKFAEAKIEILRVQPEHDTRDIYNRFNYAMAEWAETRCAPVELFQYVLSLHNEKASATDIGREKVTSRLGANYHQCLSIAFWAIGNLSASLDQVERARESVRVQGASFSCWSYLYLNPDQFLKDLSEMSDMFNGKGTIPAFMVRAGVTSLAQVSYSSSASRLN